MMNRGLTSILAEQEARKTQQGRSRPASASSDKRRAILHARIFVVLRPPKQLAEPTQKLAKLTAKQRRDLLTSVHNPRAAALLATAAGDDDTQANKRSDEDNLVRDFEADDEADEVWDREAMLVLPIVIPITLGTSTVNDVLQAAWPYVVESWRDSGRFWHKDMVPQPLPDSSGWFSLRMVSSRWRDPTQSDMRACLEPPVAAMLSGFAAPDFQGLEYSLHRCSFQERALLRETLVKKVLPPDLRAIALRNSSSSAGGALAAQFRSSSSYFTGKSSGSKKKNAAANATHFRVNFLLTLSTQFLLQEHLTCCEARTREAVFRSLDSFFSKFKSIEQRSLSCAVTRTEQRHRVEGLFADLVETEARRRQRIEDGESTFFGKHLLHPYKEMQDRVLPVLKEAYAIRCDWRRRLAEDMEKAKVDKMINAMRAISAMKKKEEEGVD